jgi:hypothetical protein
MWTWYDESKDSFGVLLPFKHRKISVLFYVPKTEEYLDHKMDYFLLLGMYYRLRKTELLEFRVTFPLIYMNLT